jgi:hypothetical protein
MPDQDEPSFRRLARAGDLPAAIEPVAGALATAPPEPGEPAATAGQETLAPWLAALDFSVHVSARYHARRRAWYDRLHRIVTLVIATAASASVAAILGGLTHQALYLSLAVAAAGVLELAYALPERARLEDALYRRFNELAAEIAGAGTVDLAQLKRWEARRLLIRSDADDRFEALRRICHNLEAEARSYPAEARYALWPWQRLLAQLVSLPPLPPLARGPLGNAR